MKLVATHLVEFSEQKQGTETYLSISIDSELNQGRYSFSPGNEVYLTVHTSHPIVSLFASWGSLSFSHEIVTDEEEYLPIVKEREKSLRYLPIDGTFSYEWLGPNRGNVVVDGRKLSFVSDDFFGFLHVTYKARAKIYLLRNVSQPGAVCVILANEAGNTAYQVIEFTGEEGAEELADVSVVVKDMADGHPVAGVVVMVDGNTVGITDENGRVYAGKLTKGRHDLRLVPQEPYLKSDEDGLANDWFTLE